MTLNYVILCEAIFGDLIGMKVVSEYIEEISYVGLGPKVVVKCCLNSGGSLGKNFAINFFGDSAIQGQTMERRECA